MDRNTLPVAAVHLPAIAENGDDGLYEPGTPRKDARDFLSALYADHQIVIVSPIANTYAGNRLLLRWLQSNGLDYDDVWTGFGYPPHAKCIAGR